MCIRDRRNAPTQLMKEENYGKDYDYPHNHPEHFTIANTSQGVCKKHIINLQIWAMRTSIVKDWSNTGRIGIRNNALHLINTKYTTSSIC